MPTLPRNKILNRKKYIKKIKNSQEIALKNNDFLNFDEYESDSGSSEWFSGNSDNPKTYLPGNYLKLNIIS